MVGKSATSGVNTASGPGGAGQYKVTALATTNSALIKTGQSRVYGWLLDNLSASTRYVKLYNKASAPVVGTDPVQDTISIPAGGCAPFWAGDIGLNYPLGIGIGITAGGLDSDVAPCAAGDVLAHIFYA